jgi:hypothetical protein
MDKEINGNLNEKLVSTNQLTSEEFTPEPVKNVRSSMTRGSLNDHVAGHYIQYFYLFCIMGLVNNVGYVMVGTAAHDLAKQFNKKNLMPLFQF